MASGIEIIDIAGICIGIVSIIVMSISIKRQSDKKKTKPEEDLK